MSGRPIDMPRGTIAMRMAALTLLLPVTTTELSDDGEYTWTS